MSQILHVGSHKTSSDLTRLTWQRTFGTICKDHPKYKALRKPACDCPTCWDFWNKWQRVKEKHNI